ncbi:MULTISPECIES: glucuronate isomerase [Sphingobacterium]|uniref:glucuronate isomerase n=1 Tax=Sphingobacterium TaxID=28453 RepID=UPI0013DD02EE|nr:MULTISPECIES: glucuronate isomerase [unclassified Sphingobacterium]
MRAFLDENFLLNTGTAEELYHNYSKSLPIIDYHNHLPPEQIAQDTKFDNLGQLWLAYDHYKWRAMRAQGISEEYITGEASDKEKFLKWAEVVPYTLRNPLYHWTHLELQRYFGITALLSPKTAEWIYEETAGQIAEAGFSARGLLKRMNVDVVCTTDDPLDSLAYHQQVAKEGESFRLLPAFRPDKAMNAGNVEGLNEYVNKLEGVTGLSIDNFKSYLDALRSRHDHFSSCGCTVSDHGIEHLYAAAYSDQELNAIFEKIRRRKELGADEVAKFKSALLVSFAEWNHEKNWVQQYHLGPLRNNNTRMLQRKGTDTGHDSIGDFSQALALSRFLDRLDSRDKLAKTVLYNLNPADNELFASMVGNFNDGSVRGKIQFGSAWWFLDQKDGMTKQINALSNIGLISNFVGMLTDSRSFLSFPRHEYFRRLICDIFGEDMERGEIPNDIEWVGKIIGDISYYNAREYFRFF